MEQTLAVWQGANAVYEAGPLLTFEHYAGDLTSVEIVEVLDMPEGTVRSDLTRSRTVLAGLMAVRDV
jgi:hypothetical protein